MQPLFIYINRRYFNSITSIFAILNKPAYSHKDYGPIHLSRNSYFIQQRSMHRLGSMNGNQKTLIKEVSNTTLDIMHIITNEEVVTNLIKNNPKPLLSKTLNYMNNNQDSSVQMKNNIFSGIINKPINLKDISTVYKDIYPQSKLHIVENGHVYSRVIGEIPIAHNFTNRFEEHFNSTLFTGDTLITAKKGQTNPDLIQKLLYGKEIENDIKAGNTMSRHPLKGTIGQLLYENNTQIRLPNDPIDLADFAKKRIVEFNCFNADLKNEKYKMILKEEQQYKDYVREIELITNNISLDIIYKHIEIEKILMRIQSLPSMPKRPSYINIIKLEPGRILTSKETEFLEGIIPYINKDIFKNQNHYNIFIRRILRVYNETIDNKAISRAKELKGTSWEHTFLDRIDTDIF